MTQRMLTLLLGTLGSLYSQGHALAQVKPAQAEPETTVLSDSLTHDDAAKLSIFKGNVILTRGLLRLTADELQLTQDINGFQHGKAIMKSDKKVVIIEERPENYEIMHAEGDSATYNGQTEVMHLIGHAIVTRMVCGKAVDTVRGETVIYNSKASTYRAIGGATAPDNGRVRSVVQPRSQADAAVDACRKQYGGKPMPSTIKPQ